MNREHEVILYQIDEVATAEYFSVVQKEGNREVNRNLNYILNNYLTTK